MPAAVLVTNDKDWLGIGNFDPFAFKINTIVGIGSAAFYGCLVAAGEIMHLPIAFTPNAMSWAIPAQWLTYSVYAVCWQLANQIGDLDANGVAYVLGVPAGFGLSWLLFGTSVSLGQAVACIGIFVSVLVKTKLTQS